MATGTVGATIDRGAPEIHMNPCTILVVEDEPAMAPLSSDIDPDTGGGEVLDSESDWGTKTLTDPNS
jgi:hypothetical protein